MKYKLFAFAALSALVVASTSAYAINCVAYARQVTGMGLSGDAYHWWDSAGGRYPRGHKPAPGAVMVFARTRHMSSGHVAIVRAVRGPREILIDQANWLTGRLRGTVSHAVSVIDVSPGNDWSAAEVEWGRTGTYGRVNPIRGFIYRGTSNIYRDTSNAGVAEVSGASGEYLQDAVYHEAERKMARGHRRALRRMAAYRILRHHELSPKPGARATAAHHRATGTGTTKSGTTKSGPARIGLHRGAHPAGHKVKLKLHRHTVASHRRTI